MRPRALLDTNVVVHWLYEPPKLSRAQARFLVEAEKSREPVAVSAITLLELVGGAGERPRKGPAAGYL